MSLVRSIELYGFKVEVHNFGYASYYYPAFNGNAEFKVTSQGFKDLCSYLRTVRYHERIVRDCELILFGSYDTLR